MGMPDSKTLDKIVRRGERASHQRDLREPSCREAVDQEHVRQTAQGRAF
jgi:hypothetical protein